MSWWWAGAIGAAKLKCHKHQKSVGLVIGVIGQVGNRLAEILSISDIHGGPWKVYDVARSHRPNWDVDHPVECVLRSTKAESCSVNRAEGLQLRFSGRREDWESYSEASDVDLIAEQQIWAVVDPYARNERFNINNRVVFKWKHIWKVLVEQYEIEEYGFDQDFSLVEMIKDKGSVWDEIKENQLWLTKLEEVGMWPEKVEEEEIKK
ncbi:putative oxidoreductase [Rosa chinensis]|uniref:Putative oxidoreductase n=1 Tax=Rosa chinensis TaxID=74649 RepID=A0A2P6QGV8_ROSCH|nr:putative oxidoreductase [Rosa chinensis]